MAALTISDIASSLSKSGARLKQVLSQTGWNRQLPLSSAYQWNSPAFSIELLERYLEITVDRINGLSNDQINDPMFSRILVNLPDLLDALNFNNIAQDLDAVLGSYVQLLDLINNSMPDRPPEPQEIDWESIHDKSLLPRDLARRLRAVETMLKNIEPRAETIEDKIRLIEEAHDAAIQLPADIIVLEEHRESIRANADAVSKMAASVESERMKAVLLSEEIETAKAHVDAIITRSEQALRGSTGVGLASAFEERSKSLKDSGRYWVGGLVAALIAAFVVGHERIATLKDVLTGSSSASVIWANAMLALIGVAAPIWFAWLSTKQIGANHRLSEDYAFKSSVSKAYEGYRKEAIDLDPSLRARLFATALTRLEEAPIRLLEQEHHSSPLQELLSNPTIRKSLEGIPGITDKIIALIPTKGAAAAAVIVPAAAVGASLSQDETTDDKQPS